MFVAGMMQKGLKYALLFIGVFAMVSYIVMYLWNWLLPDIIGASFIGFWQAAGLLLLSRILFGGFGQKKNKPWNKRSSHWKSKMQNKWAKMSQEQKLQFKAKMDDYCPKSWKEDNEASSSKEEEPSSSSFS